MEEFVNSLTTEQYINLLNIVHGEIPAEIQSLSDDELLSKLKE